MEQLVSCSRWFFSRFSPELGAFGTPECPSRIYDRISRNTGVSIRVVPGWDTVRDPYPYYGTRKPYVYGYGGSPNIEMDNGEDEADKQDNDSESGNEDSQKDGGGARNP